MIKINSNKGFTLIELLIVTAVIGILAIVSATVFNSILSSQNKTNIINEIRQNGNLVIDKFERDVRNANQIVATAYGSEVLTITIQRNDGPLDWQCDTVNGEILRSGEKILNSNDISGVQLLVNPPPPPPDPVICDFLVTDSNGPQIVTFRFTLQQRNVANIAEFDSQVEFQTTVGTRSY